MNIVDIFSPSATAEARGFLRRLQPIVCAQHVEDPFCLAAWARCKRVKVPCRRTDAPRFLIVQAESNPTKSMAPHFVLRSCSFIDFQANGLLRSGGFFRRRL